MAGKVTKIPSALEQQTQTIRNKLNVCAYARVSTGSREQADSYASQITYYTKLIEDNPLWNFAGIYADQGLTGTKIGRRNEFKAMITACESGSIDLIIVKSVTRFCRNTVDCIKTIRKLKEIGVGIFFEKENINTLSEKSELLITALSALAQSESEDFSGNNNWAIQKRFRDGTFIISSPAYGYTKDKEGNLIIEQEEAKVVRLIFESYLRGEGCYLIARKLNELGVDTKRNAPKWTDSQIKTMINNPVYEGDMIYQKTYTEKVFPYEKKTNHGERTQYLVQDNHPAIITREEAELARELAEYRKNIIRFDKDKVNNRYCFSGKLRCSECGSTLRRQKIMVGTPKERIQWCCNTHIYQMEKCANKAIREEEVEQAFIKMWQKLQTNRHRVLEPFLNAMIKLPMGKETKGRLEEIEKRIQEYSEQDHILNQVMRNGYMEPAIFMEKRNQLMQKLCEVRREKTEILNKHRKLKEIMETENIMRILDEKEDILTEFDEQIFLQTVEHITVTIGHDIIFHMINGMKLTERTEDG